MNEPTIIICPPPAPQYLSRQEVMAVGFGYVAVYRDGEAIWAGNDETIKVERFARMAGKDPDHEWIIEFNTIKVERFARMAGKDPDHEWIIEFNAPLQEQTYQRQPNGRWLLTDTGPGFA